RPLRYRRWSCLRASQLGDLRDSFWLPSILCLDGWVSTGLRTPGPSLCQPRLDLRSCWEWPGKARSWVPYLAFELRGGKCAKLCNAVDVKHVYQPLGTTCPD